MPARIAVLVSGRGRNLEAIIKACAEKKIQGQIVGVISNEPAAAALDRARAAGISVWAKSHKDFSDRPAFDRALKQAVAALEPDIVVLAGFMRILGDDFVANFHGRMINIHPSLLPRHRGLNTHRQALAAGDPEHGATVHFVSDELDGGPMIIQGRVRVREDDDEHSLSERVMNEVELKILPMALSWMSEGALSLEAHGVLFRGHRLIKPLQLEHLTETFQ